MPKKILPGQIPGLIGARTYFFTRNLPESGTLVVILPTEKIEIWQENLLTLKEHNFTSKNYSVITFPENDPIEQNIALNELFSTPGNKLRILLTSAGGLEQKVYSPENFFQRAILPLRIGHTLSPEKVKQFLSNSGYQAQEIVTQPGEFSWRGQILDIWEIRHSQPWRLVYDGDVIESIKEFRVNTQRSENWHHNDFILSLKPGTDVSLKEIFKGKKFYYPENFPPLQNKNWNFPAENFRELVSFAGDISFFLKELKKYLEQGYQIYIFAETMGEKERLQDLLFENAISLEKIFLTVGNWYGPFASVTEEKIAFFTTQQVFYQQRRSFPKKFLIATPAIPALPEIKPGDYVVHERYGIGRYLGLKIFRTGNEEGEYLTIQYRGDDRLYIPVSDFYLIHPYVGTEGARPRLYSLDTALWERVKQRAKEKANEVARKLLQHYARRQKITPVVFKPDNHLERELANSFPYPLTPDQENTIKDILENMEKGELRDYLVIGDVGFGKTEVALRAAMRAAVNSYQTAFLVPTTVLAMQHYKTFQERLKPFPVNVAILSRFQAPSEQKKIISEIKKGLIDIVIGTHRLLSADVSFANLGLLLVDEEHRFGVRQKEHIRFLSGKTSTIYFTATPIPRTLLMTMGNLRRLSIIETAPIGRRPIITSVLPWDIEVATEAIRKELLRGGQVYYVHNRIETMLSRFQQMQKRIPARWAFIHGKMPAKKIEKVMTDFWNKKIDCLMATTIIESGLDIPSVNTMLIEEAENFGLAQLYQLRGRIGRSDIQAYCYFFYSENFTETGAKRLQAISEFGHLGAGYSLARRDMEIRGAGNILGYEQHGFINNVGLELYLRLINSAAEQLTGKISPEQPELPPAFIDLKIPALIPPDYIPSEARRIYYYRQIIAAKNSEALKSIQEEITDQFGKLPEQLKNLFFVAKLQIYCRKLKITSIREVTDRITISFSPDSPVQENFIQEIINNYWQKIRFSPQGPALIIEKKFFPDQKDILLKLLEKM